MTLGELEWSAARWLRSGEVCFAWHLFIDGKPLVPSERDRGPSVGPPHEVLYGDDPQGRPCGLCLAEAKRRALTVPPLPPPVSISPALVTSLMSRLDKLEHRLAGAEARVAGVASQLAWLRELGPLGRIFYGAAGTFYRWRRRRARGYDE